MTLTCWSVCWKPRCTRPVPGEGAWVKDRNPLKHWNYLELLWPNSLATCGWWFIPPAVDSASLWRWEMFELLKLEPNGFQWPQSYMGVTFGWPPVAGGPHTRASPQLHCRRGWAVLCALAESYSYGQVIKINKRTQGKRDSDNFLERLSWKALELEIYLNDP